ncbi:MAG TPA: BatA domain-containing protein [Candidatus Binataceae bacterium]|nr:BatA domain-containing protein [Candidatus Binataceae bacterium]
MGLLYPGALIFFAIVPALVLAYLARERPARIVVSSVLAFRALRGLRNERYGGKPRFDWMFLVELLLLCLAVLAMAGPFVIRKSNPIAVMIDNSAAMQVKLPTGATRFDDALGKTGAMLSGEDGGGKISVFVTAPAPHRIAPPFDSVAEARHAIAELHPVDAPDDSSAVTAALKDLASGSRFTKVIFASFRVLAAPAPGVIHEIVAGDPAPNLALSAFTLRREVFGADTLHARINVSNFSPTAADITVTVTGDGRRLASAHASLAAGDTGALEFPSLAPARIYRAELTPADVFGLDNVAYATSGAVREVSILFITPTPADAAGLGTIPGAAVKVVGPDQFAPTDLARADVAIFEYSTPKQLPPVNTLMVMPPPDPVFGFAVEPAANIQIARWLDTDALTDSVNFRMLNLRDGEFFGQHPWMAAVVSGQGGGLILRGERGGHRFVATGFNPFPYLGRKNLPMSVLTLNVMSYLAGLGANAGSDRTGRPWLVPAGVESVTLPSGAKVKATPGTLFTEVAEQGIYELSGAGAAPTPRAVNLDDLAVSDLESVPPLRLESAAAAPPASASFLEKASLSPWLLLAIIALGSLEAIIVYRRRRGAMAEA